MTNYRPFPVSVKSRRMIYNLSIFPIVALLPPLPAPELKNGMKGHSWVVLLWNTQRLSNVTYYVQARMPDTAGPWEITTAAWLGGGAINVTNLRPFVTYKVGPVQLH